MMQCPSATVFVVLSVFFGFAALDFDLFLRCRSWTPCDFVGFKVLPDSYKSQSHERRRPAESDLGFLDGFP